MPELNNSPSSTEEGEAEAIMICLDTTTWMENSQSAMFKDQVAAVQFYCDKKIKSHPRTIIGACGSTMYTLYCSQILVRPTRDFPMIMDIIHDGHIGEELQLLTALGVAYKRFFESVGPDMKRRIVYFVGSTLHETLDKAELIGTVLKDINAACDVICFGDPYMDKRQFFDTLIKFADSDGNCNICHVPPESSVLEALSRSKILIPRFGGGTSSAHSVQHDRVQHDKNMPIVVYVKPSPSYPGFSPRDADYLKTDCPFCQRVLLTLEEKEVTYNIHFMRKKPKWFLKTNPDGILPMIKFSDGTVVSNSDVIVKMIEEMYPERPLENPPHFAFVGLKILPKLAAFLKRKDRKSEQALLRELDELDCLLQHGPYVIGKEITAVDLSLAPKLYHLLNASDKLTVPEHLTYVQRYTELLFNRPSFKKTKPSQEDVKEGWRRKVKDARG